MLKWWAISRGAGSLGVVDIEVLRLKDLGLFKLGTDPPDGYPHAFPPTKVCVDPAVSPEAREYYLAKGRVLAGFLHEGMTVVEVRRVLGVRPGGCVFDGRRWSNTYAPLGVTVHYRVAEAEVAGR